MKLRFLSLPSLATALVALPVAAHADLGITADNNILSGVQDASNLWSADTGYGFQLGTSSTDPVEYLNQINLVPGSGWDSNLNFNISNQLGNGFPSNDYTLGTAIAPGSYFYWSDVVDHQGAFSNAIAPGIYNFDVQFLGGTSSTSTGLLADIGLQVEIVNRIDASVGVSYDTQTIGPGGTATVSNTLTNNMASRTLVSNTWFLTPLSNGSDSLSFNFVGNWSNQSLAPGASRTDLHSTWTASPTQTPGDYVGTTGIVGGLYAGDQFYFADNNNTLIHVNSVPEPFSLIALGLGAVLIRRRK